VIRAGGVSALRVQPYGSHPPLTFLTFTTNPASPIKYWHSPFRFTRFNCRPELFADLSTLYTLLERLSSSSWPYQMTDQTTVHCQRHDHDVMLAHGISPM
jgi:hypothetical protein